MRMVCKNICLVIAHGNISAHAQRIELLYSGRSDDDIKLERFLMPEYDITRWLGQVCSDSNAEMAMNIRSN